MSTVEEMQINLESEGLSFDNVTCWNGRPRRHRQKPVTYWEEFVESDTWYAKKLLEDVPLEELHAACYDENFENDSVDSVEDLLMQTENNFNNFSSEDENYAEDELDGYTTPHNSPTSEEDEDLQWTPERK